MPIVFLPFTSMLDSLLAYSLFSRSYTSIQWLTVFTATMDQIHILSKLWEIHQGKLPYMELSS